MASPAAAGAPLSGGSPMGDMMAAATPGSGGDDAQARLQEVMQQLQTLRDQIQAVGSSVPQFGPEVQAMQAALKRMISKAGQLATVQSASSKATPMAGQ